MEAGPSQEPHGEVREEFDLSRPFPAGEADDERLPYEVSVARAGGLPHGARPAGAGAETSAGRPVAAGSEEGGVPALGPSDTGTSPPAKGGVTANDPLDPGAHKSDLQSSSSGGGRSQGRLFDGKS